MIMLAWIGGFFASMGAIYYVITTAPTIMPAMVSQGLFDVTMLICMGGALSEALGTEQEDDDRLTRGVKRRAAQVKHWRARRRVLRGRAHGRPRSWI